MQASDPSVLGKQYSPTMLIVDKEGMIGKPLAQQLSEKATVVLVSREEPPADSSIIYVPFSETIPTIPDGMYHVIFFVFNPHNKELLEPLYQKAIHDSAQFFIVVRPEHMPLLSEQLPTGSAAHIVVVGDIFGEGTQEIDIWLQHAKKTKKVILSQMGLNSWYPVYFPDVIHHLVQLAGLSHATKQVFLLAPTHPVTQITLAHALQKIEPMLRIDFGGDEKDISGVLPKGSPLLPEYNTVEKIKDYYQKVHIKEESAPASFQFFTAPQITPAKKKHHKSLWLFFVYTILVFIFTPTLLIAGSGELGKTLLIAGLTDMEQGKFDQAQQKIQAAQANIDLSFFSLSLVDRELSLINQTKVSDSIHQNLTFADTASQTLLEASVAAGKLQRVLLGTSPNPSQDTAEGTNALRNTLITLEKLQTDKLPQQYKGELALLTTYLPYIETFVDNLPSLLGAAGDRKYLILFQNNSELRPGGGFIGSYGLLSLSRGQVKNFTIHDVYDADGQLQGHVEPPFAIRRYIPLVHLYLRDSNFDVDGLANAKKAALMLEAETGDKVDGVAAIDLSFVARTLGVLGNVYVPSYNQTVTKDNFFLLAEQHAEKNFFAGSTQKKDFLSAFFSAMEEKVTTAKNIAYEKLLQAALQSVEEKHALLALSDSSIQEALSVNGFSSALFDTRAPEKGTVNDFLGINEANIGVNKVNYYLKRSVSQKVLVNEKGQVKESVTLSLTNTSTGEWPGGDYKNYLRFILPKGVHIDGISIDEKDQKLVSAVTDPKIYESRSFVAPNGLEVETTQEDGKSITGFLVLVPAGKTQKITVSYTLADIVDIAQPLSSYSLQLFKQPGIETLPYSLDVAYPQEFAFLKSSLPVELSGSVISLKNTLVKDTILTASFAKK